MTVIAPATSLSIHQVLLAHSPSPIQVGANIQIRTPPLHRRQLTQSWNSKRWFIHYLSSQSWILILKTLLLQLATWTLPPKPHHLTPENFNLCHFRDAQRPREIYQLESASESLSREIERTLSTQITVLVTDTLMNTIDIWIFELHQW